MSTQPARPQPLRHAAAALLRANDLGGRTKASADLYPHQWSWDSAFIAVGWSHLDVGRAAAELSSLLAAQWANGKVPHIVFNPGAPPSSYWPGPSHWACQVGAGIPGAPEGTSGLLQPAVHALAALHIWRRARRQGGATSELAHRWLGRTYPRLLAWHRYLLTERDPEHSGLVSIYHPWESGMDNSPRWDQPLSAILPQHPLGLLRPDLAVVLDERQRPTDADYDHYRRLVELLRASCYDDSRAQAHHPFLVKDALASGILVAANRALLTIARAVGARSEDRRTIRAWLERGRQGLRSLRDPASGLSADLDVRTGRLIPAATVAGFAELVAGVGERDHRDHLVRTLQGPAFAGHPDLRWPVPPSVSPLDPAFQPRAYWRGPSWPVLNWLLWWALREAGQELAARRLRRAGLEQIAATGVFPEYVEPFTGEPLGSVRQSWTAAAAIDWLAAGYSSAAPRCWTRESTNDRSRSTRSGSSDGSC